jgi:hypothetical protein
MNKLLRRTAVCVALPLGIGAPAVLVAAPAYAATTETALTVNDTSPVYGQRVRGTATVTSAGQPVTEGTVLFTVEEPSGTRTEFGPVAVDASGKAVSPVLRDADGTPFDVSQGGDFYTVGAEFQETEDFDPSSATVSPVQVGPARTTTAIQPGPTTITADVTGALPGGVQQGSLKPSGEVDFTVNGAPVGSAQLDVDGRATIGYALPNGAPQVITASYAGDTDDNYLGSEASRTRTDPTITAKALSKYPRTRAGWYRKSVDIWFRCDPAGSELVVECPDNVKLRHNGENQSVTRTIVAADGGMATVTVSGINIDRKAPVIRIVDRRCRASDRLSGLRRDRCHIRVAKNGTYVAVAVDRAGNRTVRRGRF